jgi:hypothetical protein
MGKRKAVRESTESVCAQPSRGQSLLSQKNYENKHMWILTDALHFGGKFFELLELTVPISHARVMLRAKQGYEIGREHWILIFRQE